MNTRLTVLACVLGALSAAPVQAQSNYPNRPLRLIVPFPPGGGNDILARAVGSRLTEVVGQQVIVDNRPGAGGMLGAQTAANAEPDGYTLFLGSLGNLAHNPALRPKLPYDPLRDFAPVSLLATSPFILVVTPQLPAKTLKELIALAKAKPGALNMGSAGIASSLHMTGELFEYTTGIDLVHIPFKGTAPALTEVMSGQIHVMFSTMPPALTQIKAGKVRALAVTGPKRSPTAPDVPTAVESGVQFEVLNWQGLLAPGKTPATLVATLNKHVHAALARPGMEKALAAQGLDAAAGTPEAFRKLMADEIARWKKLVQAANIKAE
jgi:tripartite-type tricarboxylate transporter receptor subunit TctC